MIAAETRRLGINHSHSHRKLANAAVYQAHEQRYDPIYVKARLPH